MRDTISGEHSQKLYRAVLETLEKRMLLHAGHAHSLLELGIPADKINDGHIQRTYFETLSPKIQAQIDPHSIEEVYDKPINYDEIFGIPLSVTMGDGASPDADTFPDWYPAVNGGITVSNTSGRTLVNFPTAINNQGTGPGIGISALPGSPIPAGAPITSWLRADGSQAVLQPIFNFTGGTYTLSYYRDAGSFTYHPGHTHYHYEGYNNYRLRQSVGGQPGPYVTHRPDGTEIIGEKIGFCLINVGSQFTMENGQSSTTLPGYNAGGQPGTGCGFTQGVHVGKYDQYGSGTTGQWLDITGVPNGDYFLEITVDGENVMAETNEANNTKSFPFNVNVNPPTGGINPDQFDTPGNNDSFATATNMGVRSTSSQLGLTIHWGQDYDFFRFVAASNGPGTITSAGGANFDLYLYDANQNQIAASTQGSTGSESIPYNFVAGQTYYVKGEAYNSTTVSSYQINWNIKPQVNALAIDTGANELGSNFGTIALARNGQIDTPLSVNFSVGGTAIRGTDYQIYFDGFEVLGNSVSIGSANSQAALEVRPIYDNSPEPAETVIITVSNSAAYEVGGTPTGTVTIGDAGPEVSQVTHVWQTAPNQLVLDIDRALLSTVNLGDFQIMNLDTSVPVTGQTLANQDFGTFVRATLTFSPGVLADAEYQLTIPAGTMTNSLGDINATAFTYDFFQLTGDANHDGRVNLFDYNILSGNYNQSPRDFSQGDFNYDNLVNIADYNLLVNKYGTDFNTDGALAAGSPLRGGRTAPGGIFATGKEIDDSDKDIEELI